MRTQKSLDEFKNEPFTDFTKTENANAVKAAIEQVRSELGREYPILIDGEKITLEKKFESINPSEKSQTVGVFSDADADAENLAAKAIDAATEAFKTWRSVPASERQVRGWSVDLLLVDEVPDAPANAPSRSAKKAIYRWPKPSRL